MKIEILHVLDCPNLDLLDQRLREALADRPAVITHRLVADVDTAATTGMTGSPTLLVDGNDPFESDAMVPSLSCRLYPHEDGHVEGVPSIDALRHALGRQCCDQPSTLTRTRRRAIPADPTERAVHQAILRAFAATGHPPTVAELDHLADSDEITTVLQRLHDTDTIRLDADGTVRVAYPFSATPTRHHVQLSPGSAVYAMCAIDALGMPAMLHTDATITTLDPITNDPITVTVTNGQSTWNPPTATAFVGAISDDGPSADTCCDHLNLFTNTTNAQSWMDTHPEVNGELLTGEEAENLGRHIFGALLADAAEPTLPADA